MAQYIAFLKDGNGSTTPKHLITTSEKSRAIQACLNEVRSSHRSEIGQAEDALKNRGYYCMGYSSREVYIEEKE